MSLLAVVLFWLFLLTVLVSLLRRYPLLPGLVLAAGLAVLVWRLWQAPTAEPFILFGQRVDPTQATSLMGFTFLLDESARASLLLLLGWGSVFGLIAGWMEADRVLFPSIPLIIAAMVLALASTSLLLAPFWLVVAAILMTFPAQGARPRLARGALRTLLSPILALPLFLVAAWVFSQIALGADPGVSEPVAWRTLVIGIALLLTPVPLHGWIVSLGEETPPLAAAWIVGVWQIGVYLLVRRIFLLYPTLTDYADPALLLPWLAFSQMAWAAFFAFGSQRLGQFWGYLLLWDYGATFLLWSMAGEVGTQSILWLLLVRPFVLCLVAAAIIAIYKRFGENPTYQDLHGISERLPVATRGIVGGALFMVGWPLGALFPIRIATFQLTQIDTPLLFLGVMLAFLVMTLAVVRLQRALFQPLRDPTLRREPVRLIWLIIPLLLLNVIFSIHPALLSPIILRLADWLTRF